MIFLQKVKDRYEDVRDNLATGSANDYSEYKRLVGMIQGLRIALDIMDEAHEIANERSAA